MRKNRKDGSLNPASLDPAAVTIATGVAFDAVLAATLKSLPASVEAMGGSPRTQFRSACALFGRAVAILRQSYVKKTSRRLCVAETISLGEKRFVALLTIDGQEFLIGGGTAGVSVLATLDNSLEAASRTAESCQ